MIFFVLIIFFLFCWFWVFDIVNVFVFGGYEEFEMFIVFEESIGIKVNLKIYDGFDEEMIVLMKLLVFGIFDVIMLMSVYIF